MFTYIEKNVPKMDLAWNDLNTLETSFIKFILEGHKLKCLKTIILEDMRSFA